MPKKQPIHQHLYQVYQLQTPLAATCEEHIQRWWRAGGTHYRLVAEIRARGLDEVGQLIQATSSAWYDHPGVGRLPEVEVRANSHGDVILCERQAYMLEAGGLVALEQPQDIPLQKTRQQAAIFAVAWSPDSRRFAACGKQELVRVYACGQEEPWCESSYDLHKGYAQAVAWSPDGTRIASADSRDALHIWEVAAETAHVSDASGGRILVCRDQVAPTDWYAGTYALAWGPSGRCVATGNHLGIVRVWDATTGTCTFTHQGHQGAAVRRVAFSPDGNHLASAGDGRTVQIWNVRSRSFEYMYAQFIPGELLALAWSPDGKQLLVGGTRSQALLLYHQPPGTSASQEIALARYATNSVGVSSVAFAPDSHFAVAGCVDGSVQVVDATSARHVYTYHGHAGRVNAVAWSPDGKHILSGSDDTTVAVWCVGPDILEGEVA